MKKCFTLLIFLLVILNLQARNLTANFSCGVFDLPGSSSYIETYLSVKGSSINIIPAGNDKRHGEIEVICVIKSSGAIVNFDKYILTSPEIAKSDSVIPDFFDLHRISLNKGDYEIELSIRDKNSESSPVRINQSVSVVFQKDTINISQIQLLDKFSEATTPGKFTKNGYDIIPVLQPFLPKEQTKLKFYAEIYRSDISPASDYLVRCSISNNESHKVVDDYVVNIKQTPKPINVIMGEMPIEELLSGNYFFNVEVRNKQNQLIAFRNLFFQRSNPANKPVVTSDISALDVSKTFISRQTNQDSLNDFISCLYPISSNLENQIAENVLLQSDVRFKQQFFYHFWSQRNPDDPAKAWSEYKDQVEKVNAAYSTLNKKGYETDRGRVFLQYGPPSSMANNIDDVEAYPYEIWHYYKLTDQSNRKFVFYTVERSSNNYRLLHSDARGELTEPQWELKLHRTQQYGGDHDKETPFDVYGSRTRENFQTPK